MAKRVTKKVAKKVAAKKPLPFLEPDAEQKKTLDQIAREQEAVWSENFDQTVAQSERHSGPNWPMIGLIAFALAVWYAVFRYLGILP